MGVNNKTLEDLELSNDRLSKNTLITLQFVINHYNETNQCFHITHEKHHYCDTGCRLCGNTDVIEDRFCSWNYYMDCDDNNCFESLSSLLLNKIMKKNEKVIKN